MLTSKAQRIFCYNVTCVASKKSCSSRSHLSGCFKCSSLLAHLMSIWPMECWLATLNVSSAIMSHALEQVHAARIGVICECFNCSSLLACEAATVQLSICFPIGLSHIHLTASLYLCPADCFQDILFEQAGNSHWNKLAFLRHIKWHIH